MYRSMAAASNSFTVSSYVRGYHAYKHIWQPVVGETLQLAQEPNNSQDSFAVAVCNNRVVVGHIPYNLAPTVSAFLTRPTNTAVAEITGSRVNRGGGYGLEVPCDYKFYAPKSYLSKLASICLKLKEDSLL